MASGSVDTPVSGAYLLEFVSAVFTRLGLTGSDASLAAEALVHADLLGIDSHGVARLATHPGYVPGLRSGSINARPNVRAVRETAATALVDGDNGLGVVVASRAMAIAVDKARESGAGIVAVTNTHHLGVLIHYATMALPHDQIGVAMTNSSPQLVPTFGKRAALGTNPICLAAPAGAELPVVVDLASSVVAAGKIDLVNRAGGSIPEGWLADAEGRPTTNPNALREGGALLPLGSRPELGSYKGYGLAVLVDILSGCLSGAGFSALLDASSWHTGHFFAAYRIDAFRPADEFKQMMDEMVRYLKAVPPVAGAERVLIPGERELRTENARSRDGIPLHASVRAQLASLGSELGIPFLPTNSPKPA